MSTDPTSPYYDPTAAPTEPVHTDRTEAMSMGSGGDPYGDTAPGSPATPPFPPTPPAGPTPTGYSAPAYPGAPIYPTPPAYPDPGYLPSSPPVYQQPYQPGYQQGYQQPAYQPGYPPAYAPYAQVPGTNTMAILALVFAFVCWPVGIIMGHIARSQIRRTGEQGAGLALAGMIIGYVVLALFVLWLGLGIAGIYASSNTG